MPPTGLRDTGRTISEEPPTPDLDTTITCPLCATRAREIMPVNACQHFYRCIGCGEMLKPRPGDCCVFCSYADKVCPPKQGEGLALERG